MKRPAEMHLFADSSRGAYIPQFFAESVDRSIVSGIDFGDLADLEKGPDLEYYWDTWRDVLDKAIIAGHDGKVYTLWQDGDLWLIENGAEYDDETGAFTIEVTQ
jgi:hypothetical protein